MATILDVKLPLLMIVYLQIAAQCSIIAAGASGLHNLVERYLIFECRTAPEHGLSSLFDYALVHLHK